MKKVSLLGILVISLLLSCGTVSANLVSNGGFEDPVLPDGTLYQLDMRSGLTGWTIESGNIDLVRALWTPAEQYQSVDLSGCERGAISQSISTNPDGVYILSFALSGNAYKNPPGPDSVPPFLKKVEVFWNGISQGTFDFDTTGHTYSGMGWTTIEIPRLIATTDRTKIKFADVSALGEAGTAIIPSSNVCYGVVVDNVDVEPQGVALPEGHSVRTDTPLLGASAAPAPKPMSSPSAVCSIAGRWQRTDGNEIYTMSNDGTAQVLLQGGQVSPGTWVNNNGIFTLSWSHGPQSGKKYIDTVTMAADCNSWGGTNNYGDAVHTVRIDIPFRGTALSDPLPQPISTGNWFSDWFNKIFNPILDPINKIIPLPSNPLIPILPIPTVQPIPYNPAPIPTVQPIPYNPAPIPTVQPIPYNPAPIPVVQPIPYNPAPIPVVQPIPYNPRF